MRNLGVLALLMSAVVMAEELLTSRLIAPYLGVSLYTWTGVLSVTLACMAIGNVLGGIVADREAERSSVGWILLTTGSLLVMQNYGLILFGATFAVFLFPLWLKALMLPALTSGPAILVASMAYPLLVKLQMRNVEETGSIVGRIGAWGVMGSILGTILGGWILPATLGAKAATTAMAFLLIVLGYIHIGDRRLWRNRYACMGALFVLGDVLMPSICGRETAYYCVRIDKEQAFGVQRLTLRLDHLVHSYVVPDHPTELGYGYERVYANVLRYQSDRGHASSTLYMGGGGYVLPRYAEATYPEMRVVVAEIDPGVTRINYELLQLASSTRIKTVNHDARRYIMQASDERFDAVFGDAFNDFSVPAHLTTVEFHEQLKQRMQPHGIYAMNVIDDPMHGYFFSAMTRTLSLVWKHVSVAPQGENLHAGRNTIVILASDEPLNQELWNATRLPEAIVQTDLKPDREVVGLLSEEQVTSFLEGHPVPPLRDAFAPVDRYLAPVFRDAY